MDDAAKRMFVRWQLSPLTFVREAIRVKHISNQQEQGLEALRKIVWAKLKKHAGKVLTLEEAKYAKKRGISIMSGKGCHAIDTEILMHDGRMKFVQDVVAGDQLMGDDGTPRNVLSLARGREKMYRMQFSDGTFQDINESHILSVSCTGAHGVLRLDQVTNVSVKEYLTWSKRRRLSNVAYRKPVEFASKNLKIPPYILGLWLGDGDQSGPRFTNIDEEVISEIKNFACSRGLKYKCHEVKNHWLTGGGRGGVNAYRQNSFINDLRHYDLIKNKHIPFDYLTSSTKDRLQLIAGLIDSDGHLDKRGGRVFEFIQKRKHLTEQMRFLCRSVGMHATIHKTRKSYTLHGEKIWGDYYRMNITRNIEIIPVRVKRKIPTPITGYSRSRLNFRFDLIPLEEDDFYGFSLDGNGLFLLGDFTVTHNTGKDTFCSWAILWFLCCFELPKIPCTGPSAHQMKDVLWSEIYIWLRKSIIQDWIVWQAEKIFLKEHLGKAAFAVARTANVKQSEEEQAKTLDGFHADYMMLVIEEAASVGEPVFRALDTTMTGKCNFALLIFNPTKNHGFAIESQKEMRDQWVCLHWDAEESDRVTKDHLEYMAKKYGKDSNAYRVFVKGIPPKADPGALIPLEWVMDAVDRDLEPLDVDIEVFGLDVGAGGDESCLLRRRGPKILSLETYNTEDSEELTNWALGRMFKFEPDMVMIDSIGWGWGVAGNIRARATEINVIDINVSESASASDRFFRLRDELWWRVREAFEHRRISIPNDSVLIAELSSIRYKEPNGVVKIESKKELRARGLDSPNRADALCLTEYYETELLRSMTASNQRKSRSKAGASSWRTV
ncbi:MAG: hypothetical protein IIB56_09750 [Planctomycetes bacterium]|nr:hypothetical protein [Planctomycetota bacterium]